VGAPLACRVWGACAADGQQRAADRHGGGLKQGSAADVWTIKMHRTPSKKSETGNKQDDCSLLWPLQISSASSGSAHPRPSGSACTTAVPRAPAATSTSVGP
jgi:hypothetical protein